MATATASVENSGAEETSNLENSFHDEASQIIASAVKWSAGAAVIPLPYVDLIGLATVQVRMVRKLATAYDLDPDEKTLQGVISALLGTLASTTLSVTLVGSSLKFLPGAGTILGSMGMSAFGAASTYAIGKIFVRHFEGGGFFQNRFNLSCYFRGLILIPAIDLPQLRARSLLVGAPAQRS